MEGALKAATQAQRCAAVTQQSLRGEGSRSEGWKREGLNGAGRTPGRDSETTAAEAGAQPRP
jgi:hypothetical protein